MSKTMNKILIVDDEPGIRKQLADFLTSKGYQALTAENGNSALNVIRDNKVSVAFLDFRLPDMDGLELLKKVKILSPQTVSVIITGYSDVRIAVKTIQAGAFDYITKPLYVDEVLHLTREALEKKSTQPSRDKIILGKSESAKSIMEQIDLVAPTIMTVLISGETGTGKEYVARSIHQNSKRKSHKIVAVDSGALPENLAGSELFGHIKGAFTGANTNKKGSFELADKGTLFLDEIGNLSYENQMKMLRVLQERVVKRLGSTKDISVDVRVIAATNENLKSAVSEGKFREDLYHRINEFHIHLPPLRERKEDIEYFMQLFLKQANKQLNKNVREFEPSVLGKFMNYEWPGNLRELKNVIKRGVLLAKGERITLTCLPEEISGLANHSVYDQESNQGTDLKSVAENAEKQAIKEVLKQTNYNKTEAAEILKIDRKTLYNKMKSYKIDLDTENV
jgi:two-component system response regulator HydG